MTAQPADSHDRFDGAMRIVPGEPLARAPAPRRSMHAAGAAAVAAHGIALWLAVANLDSTIGLEAAPNEGVALDIVDEAALNPRNPALSGGADALDSAARAPFPEPTPEAPHTPPAAKASPTVAAASPSKAGPDAITAPLNPDFKIASVPLLDLDPKLPTVGKAIVTAPAPKADPFASPLDGYIARRSRSGPARAGIVDEFTRSVALLLDRNKPIVPGAGGTGKVVAEFVILPTGAIEQLRITRSSGRPNLDAIVLELLRHQQFPVPPETASVSDRTIEYIFNYR